MQTDAFSRFVETILPCKTARQVAVFIILIWIMTVFTLAGVGFMSLWITVIVSETTCVILLGWKFGSRDEKIANKGDFFVRPMKIILLNYQLFAEIDS